MHFLNLTYFYCFKNKLTSYWKIVANIYSRQKLSLAHKNKNHNSTLPEAALTYTEPSR